MTGFRSNETREFPVERTDNGVWYAFVAFDKTFGYSAFTSSKTGKRNLVEAITSCPNPFLVFGVWQGQWRTDIFVLDPKELAQLMKDKGGI